MKQKVIVIGRNYSSRLGMIRAVGMAGYDVIVIKTNGLPDSKDIDAYSKYVKEYHYAKEPNRDELISVLLTLKSDKNKTIIIPVDDYAASTIDDNIDLLKDSFLFPNINMEQGAINRLMDKNLQKELARQAGLNVAKGWVLNIMNHTYTLPSDIIYPVFPKPQISFKGNKRCMRKCNDETELRKVLNDVASQRDCPMLLEQYIEIDKEYALLGVSNGDDVIIPAKIHMLESGKGPHHGVTLQGQIFPINTDEDYLDYLKHFIQSLHFSGLFDIDLYESDGVMYFNELNLRFGASGYAVTATGINLPQFFLESLKGGCRNLNNMRVKECLFVNEKVACDDYNNGYISISDYKEKISQSNICFIKSIEDNGPYEEFLSRNFSYKRRVKRVIKQLIKHFR